MSYRIISFVGNGSGACDYYRKIMPQIHCHEELAAAGVELTLARNFLLSSGHLEADCFYFHRTIAPGFLPLVIRLKSAGKKIVWDLDDQLFAIPPWSPAARGMGPAEVDQLLLCLEYADVVTVTTERFKAQFDFPWLHDKTRVLPNLINLKDWDFPSETRAGATRFLWAGSSTHSEDLEIVAPAVLRALEELKDHPFTFYFAGMMPKSLSARKDYETLKGRVVFLGDCPLHHYPGMIRSVLPDVAFCPLVECQFNDAKSNIKYLEMTMAGAVVAASPVGPYADSIIHEFNGFICRNTDEFFDFIKYRMTTPSLIRVGGMEAKARTDVASRWSWQSHDARRVWIEFFKELADTKTS